MSPTPSPPPEDTTAKPPRTRRRRWKIAAWIIVPLVILALIVFVLPTYAARYIVRNQLDDMGIATEGIDTLRINIWNREIWLGPVTFRGEGAPIGEVKEVGLKYGVLNLFHRQALVRTLIIKGVDVQVTREMDGTITINGVDLSQFTKPKEEQPPPKENESAWGAGLDDFRFIESRVFYTDRARGTIELNVDNLELHEFHTWQPDHPGRFILDARINNMGFRAEGTARPFGEVVHADAKVSVDDVELDKIAKYTGPLGFDRRSGVLKADLSGTLEAGQGNTDASVKGEVTGTDVDSSRPDQIAMTFDRAVLKLDNRYRLAPGGAATLSGPINFELDNAHLEAAGGSSVRLANASLDLPSLTAEQTEGRTQAAISGDIALTQVVAQASANNPQQAPSLQAGTIKTKLKDIKASIGGATNLTGGLDLSLGEVRGQLPQPAPAEAMRIAANEISLSLPDLTVGTTSGETSVKTSGTLNVMAISAAKPTADNKPPIDANVQRVQLDLREIVAKLGKGGPQWSVALNAVIDALTGAVGGGQLAKANFAQITADGARADQAMAVGADKLTLGGVDIAFNRDVLTAFAGDKKDEAGQEASGSTAGGEANDGGAKPALRLGSFTLSSPAKVAFTDTSVTPEVKMNTNIKTLQVEDLDMAAPAQKTDVRLAATVNDFTDLTASGWITPFASQRNFNVLAQIEKLELPPLSPYAAKAVGANIDSGRLNLKADALANNGKLDGTILIDLRNLAFGALSKEDAQRLSASIGVPIDTAVGLLQDSDGRINLRIPISGDLSSPSFDLSDAIGQAVTGAVTGAVTAPFKLLFEPVGALAGAVGGGGPSFKPIPFAAGAAELSPEAKAFSDNLAKMLKERPKLSLRVCGKAVDQDLQALRARGELPQPTPPAPAQQGRAANQPPKTPPVDDQARSALTRLAEERTRAVRQQLVERDKIGANQVAECRAEFEPKSSAGPRVEIMF
ncbi:MAG: DUF748 domain-containing protein [Rhodospirillales bacterium]|nr:DUF748 domain-containing protein [Rhodospirillales bacterium]